MLERLLAGLVVLGLVAVGCSDSDGGEASGADLAELNVAHLQEWPTPTLFGQADGSFADAVGVPINWLPFSTGEEMAAAMVAGDVDVTASLAMTAVADAINGGADLKVVGIAVAYTEAVNCVAQPGLGVTVENAAQALVGARVMTPFGNVTHYVMLSMMDYLGVDIADLEIVEADSGAATAAAFERGDVEVGCGFGGSVVTMLESGGELIMTGAERDREVGLAAFDVIAIPTAFGDEYPGVVSAFLKATDDFNRDWAANAEDQNPVIAAASGMDEVGDVLDGPIWFTFPTIDEQLSGEWLGAAGSGAASSGGTGSGAAGLGGRVGAALRDHVEMLAEFGGGEAAVGDFAGAVDTGHLEEAR